MKAEPLLLRIPCTAAKPHVFVATSDNPRWLQRRFRRSKKEVLVQEKQVAFVRDRLAIRS